VDVHREAGGRDEPAGGAAASQRSVNRPLAANTAAARTPKPPNNATNPRLRSAATRSRSSRVSTTPLLSDLPRGPRLPSSDRSIQMFAAP
jgi:hypothetical protein